MSAWIVSKRHIDLMVELAMKYDLLNGTSPSFIGGMLWTENHRSVNDRYSENLVAPPYEYEKFDLSTLSTIAQIKQLRCYVYQTCETENYQDTIAIKLVEKLEKKLLSELPERTQKAFSNDRFTIPGWDAAPWGID